MIDDLTAYGAGSELQADVCVVGAGAAGLALARELLGSRLRVLVVEAGGLATEPEPGGGRGRGFGGTTALWAGQCIPLQPIDLERRHWVPGSGWPISLAELAPYYERAGAVLAVPGERYDESLWRQWRIAPPPIDAGRLTHTYTAWSPHPDLGRAFRREFERSANVRVLLNAGVERIEPNAAYTTVERLELRCTDGSRASVRAPACVLACGGIENARLLLASGDVDAGGLANAHGNVGRWFQDHPNGRTAVLRTDRPRALQDPYSLFYRRGRRYLPKLALAPEVQRAEAVLNCGANLEYEFEDQGLNALRRVYRARRQGGERADLGRDLRLAARGLPAAAVAAYRRLALGRSPAARPARIWLQTHSEQAPNRDSRVVLTRERDERGALAARVEWRLTELERRTAEAMTRTVAAEVRRLGLGDAEIEGWLLDPDGDWRARFSDAYHHIGTTRMADDPATGVVDADCRVHGVDGLYVAGSSVFPTSGFANPTLTIVALAIRLADRLREG